MKTKFSTVARCILLAAALINQIVAVVLSAFPVSESLVYQILSVVATVVSSIVAAWKNNDFTLLAKISGAFFKTLKDGKITADEAKELVAAIDEMDEEDKTEEDKTE